MADYVDYYESTSIKKYKALRFIRNAFRLVGLLLLFGTLAVVVVDVISDAILYLRNWPFGEALHLMLSNILLTGTVALSPIIAGIVTLATGELIKLLIDIEENQRVTQDLLIQMEENQRTNHDLLTRLDSTNRAIGGLLQRQLKVTEGEQPGRAAGRTPDMAK